MPEPVHMPLSAFDWVSILFVVAVAWWAIRSLVGQYARVKGELQKAQQKADQERAERLLRQQESVERTVQELIRVVGDLKSWVALEFVRKPDHDREIDRLDNAIAEHAERFTRELESHRDQCPGRRG